MLKTEALDLQGITTKPEKGTPQGGSISPILANLYAVRTIMLPYNIIGKGKLVMYADDGIIICNNEVNPETELKELKELTELAGLQLSTEALIFRYFEECQLRSNVLLKGVSKNRWPKPIE